MLGKRMPAGGVVSLCGGIYLDNVRFVIASGLTNHHPVWRLASEAISCISVGDCFVAVF